MASRDHIAWVANQSLGIAGRNVLRTDSLTIVCSNTGASVVLRVRYELFGDDLMVEDTTTLAGSPVTRIVFHKVSLN